MKTEKKAVEVVDSESKVTTPTKSSPAEKSKAVGKQGMYGPWQTVAITLFVYFAAQILAASVVYAIPSLGHWAKEQQESWIKNPWVTFSFILFAEAFTLGILYKFMKARKVTFRSLGINKPKAEYLGYIFGAYVLYFLIYIVSLVIAKALIPGLNLDQKQDLGFAEHSTGIALLPIFISLVILPPITEEIVVRGFLFKGLRTKLPFITAAAAASVLFAMAHLGEGGGGGLLWVAGIDTFILSFVLCYLREKTGSLWPGIGVHMLKNMVAFIVLYNILGHIR